MYNPYLISITLPLYFFLHQSQTTTFSLASNSPAHHNQLLHHITLNCGSSGNSTAEDGRKWIGDIGSNYITSLHGSKNKLISSKTVDQPLSSVIYMTARLSRSPFTYTFRVTPGQKFIRLHFYPALYGGGFERSKAFFTVKAGAYTLLSNFSASITADALATQFLVREFCVTVDENQQLIITFSPSRSGNSNEVYAFVNGIEIISIPVALYHTRDGNPAAEIVGKSDRFTIDKSIALEKVHRLNIGGNSISPIEDTGIFRDWYEDSNYLLDKSNVQPITTTIRIKYTSIPPYSAPQKVYQTSWSLIPNNQANKTDINFTWRLPVDLGFRYLLRLHFCELEYEIKESGRMEFTIFVNEQVVEAKGDLIKWSGGSGVAIYKDYVVMMEGDRIEGKHDMLLKLRPHNHEWTEPIDATLKGIEVFKLSNSNKNLARMNLAPLALASTSPKPKKLVFSSGGNAIATSVIILLTLFNIIVYELRILVEKSRGRNLSPSPLEGLCCRFSLSELISVTNNFGEELVIGSGEFGKVYKALIDDGARTVAIKRLNLQSKQGAKEFWTEIEMLSKLRHTHLVSLLGYCDERNEMILVYEFMEHGTLADHLYKSTKSGNDTIVHMSWEQRLNICIGAARGLDYLHTGIRHGIIHRDVKTTNILLDKDWIAKISDFGLCKVGATSHSRTHVSTNVKGTFGYLDPEYFLTCRLTKKSDVYAFGVVMLEMLCGRPAVDMRVEEEQRSLVLWAQQVIKENKLDQLIDPSLRGQISPPSLKVFVEVANKCLDSRPNGRPTMADVVVSLECAWASENRCIVPSTEEEGEEDFNVGGVVDKQFDESTQWDDSLPGGHTPSAATLLQYSENTQGQNKLKGKVSKVFQRSIEFLAKGTDIRWKKKVHNSNNEQSPLAHSLTRPRLQWKNVSVGSNIPMESSSSEASGGNEAHPKGQNLPTPNLRIFSFLELKIATKNFSNERVLGEGGFGKVYKGRLDEKIGSGLVFAVKNWNPGGMQGLKEWLSEMNILGRLSHPNLVRLLGYCREDGKLLLVYEFMPNGSLENHLFGSGSGVQPLPWDIRLNILIGAARGMAFLHSSEKQIIYRDFKTSTILLDESYNAKMSDFGLATMGPLATESHVSTQIRGTYSYAAPEYIATGHLYVKSDLYGFGVVLVEMLTGLRAHDKSRPIQQRNLVDWVKPYLSARRKLKNVMDSRLEGKYPPKAALQIAQLAQKCLEREPKTRPSMEGVVQTLECLDAKNRKLTIGHSILDYGCSFPCFYFSIKDIRAATNNFDDNLLIGEGTFAKEYKGWMDHGTLVVSVKVFSSDNSSEFRAEIQTQSQIRHPHIRSMIGYCNYEGALMLVLPYMAHKSLHHHLYPMENGNRDTLPLLKRLEICLGAAGGLQYLHSGTTQIIIHRDIRPFNILLDDNWVAKVSHFELAKVLPTRDAGVAARICGTVGYLDPEYVQCARLTDKIDVYSFGVVLLEVLCGRKPYNDSLDEDQKALLHWFRTSVQKKSVDQIIDPYLVGRIAPECLREFLKITWKCILDRGADRPSMDDVVVSLRIALQQQRNWLNDSEVDDGSHNNPEEEEWSRFVVARCYNNVLSDFYDSVSFVVDTGNNNE